jgi:hypothetical protein
MIHERPVTNLLNKRELLMAASLSQYATHALPGLNGYIFSNPKVCRLSWFGLTKNDYCNTALMFDIDDGFVSPFSDVSNDVNLKFMNAIFAEWKNHNYVGYMCDYEKYM